MPQGIIAPAEAHKAGIGGRQRAIPPAAGHPAGESDGHEQTREAVALLQAETVARDFLDRVAGCRVAGCILPTAGFRPMVSS